MLVSMHYLIPASMMPFRISCVFFSGLTLKTGFPPSPELLGILNSSGIEYRWG